MRFGLRTLLAVSTVCAVLCAILFAFPLAVELPILALIVLVAPSFWISGACFAHGGWRAFFVGGICAGWLPQAALMYLAATVIVSSPALLTSGEIPSIFNDPGIRGSIAFYFFLPLLITLCGGACGALVHHLFNPAATRTPTPQPTPESSRLHEPYVLLESRLTALAKEETK
ncbi:hypothetical protein [Anatilimnocola floriformis]|uniref:hypothetical protein n=1 Tax=Anatilimnocola floriformis TaxID=2948575 RepID=UPI0020C59CA9|nr:hypothetical protein [Anatilimnocola floriformis]